MNKNNKNNKKKTKYKLQVMDIVTIIFTAIILGIMIFVLYDQFAGDESNNNTVNNNQSNSTASSATASPTATPTLSDIGNIYGNITNDANVVVIDEREYFISADDNGDKHIWVTTGDTTKDLIKTNASSLNVVTDYITYAEQTDVTAYYVFYINGDGKICYVTDGPLGGSLEEKENLEEQVLLDGKYKSIDVSGQYVYYLTEEGQIGRVGILTKETAAISSEHTYESFVLYFGTIYGLNSENGKIYAMSSTPETTTSSATASPSTTAASGTAEKEEEEPNEVLMVNESVNGFAVDDYWIYVMTDNGIIRYMTDTADQKDTIFSTKVDALNVCEGAIFYLIDGELYSGSAESLIIGTVDKIGTVAGASTINITADSIYLVNETGKLMKSAYDAENDVYSEFTAMN